MQLPEFITSLPEIDLPFPPSKVKGNAMPSDRGLLVFFQILEDVELPPHSHKAQWGTVLDGKIKLKIGGETRSYGPGDSYNILAGVVHSGKRPAGTKIIDRYKLK